MPGLEVVSASRRSESSALIGGGGGVEEPIYQNSHENSPLSSFQWGRAEGATVGWVPSHNSWPFSLSLPLDPAGLPQS